MKTEWFCIFSVILVGPGRGGEHIYMEKKEFPFEHHWNLSSSPQAISVFFVWLISVGSWTTIGASFSQHCFPSSRFFHGFPNGPLRETTWTQQDELALEHAAAAFLRSRGYSIKETQGPLVIGSVRWWFGFRAGRSGHTGWGRWWDQYAPLLKTGFWCIYIYSYLYISSQGCCIFRLVYTYYDHDMLMLMHQIPWFTFTFSWVKKGIPQKPGDSTSQNQASSASKVFQLLAVSLKIIALLL